MAASHRRSWAISRAGTAAAFSGQTHGTDVCLYRRAEGVRAYTEPTSKSSQFEACGALQDGQKQMSQMRTQKIGYLEFLIYFGW
jgi:hypothetical protein